MTTLPDLDRLLKYKHPDVLKMYTYMFPDNKIPAEQAFTELLKFLWISKKYSLETQDCDDKVGFGFCRSDNLEVPIEYFMPDSMREIDQMWHEFILFTADYQDFCKHYFGEFIHHKPVVPSDKPGLPREVVERHVEKLITYICENLGEETLELWYSSYVGEEGEEETDSAEEAESDNSKSAPKSVVVIS